MNIHDVNADLMICLCAFCSIVLRLSLSSAVAGISPRPTSKRKMRSSKPSLASARVRLLLAAQIEGGGFFLKPLKALIALDMRELFEDA